MDFVVQWFPFVLKMSSTMLLVVAASQIAERSGPFVGGLIATLPVSVGPMYVFLATQNSAEFIADSAIGSVVANAANAVFLLVFVVLAPKFALSVSLVCSVGTWVVSAWCLRQYEWQSWSALGLNAVVFAVCIFLTPDGSHGTKTPGTRGPTASLQDLLGRAVLVGLFVAIVVSASNLLGPTATGTAAVFPISLSSLAMILYPRIGGAATAAALASALRGMIGYGLALLVLHLFVVSAGKVTSLLLALATSLCWSAALMLRSRRSPAPVSR
jgi:uncharacterized membrane protein (GlpM family)